MTKSLAVRVGMGIVVVSLALAGARPASAAQKCSDTGQTVPSANCVNTSTDVGRAVVDVTTTGHQYYDCIQGTGGCNPNLASVYVADERGFETNDDLVEITCDPTTGAIGTNGGTLFKRKDYHASCKDPDAIVPG